MSNTRTVLAIVALLVGGHLAGQLLHAQAQSNKQYTECFAARLWEADARAVHGGNFPKMLKVPAGWTPVGGTTTGDFPNVLLCR